MWTGADLKAFESRGISEEAAVRQLELLRNPPAAVRLERPCTLEDGIIRLGDGNKDACLAEWEKAASGNRISAFIPASGAASRMFKTLQQAEPGNGCFRSLRENLQRYPFYEGLKALAEERGLTLEALEQDDEALRSALLGSAGLDYAQLPKALLAFHRYPDGVRTAFEEHWVEASRYARGSNGSVRLHFTVSPEHRALFARALARLRPVYEKKLGLSLELGFSEQLPATDTIALDANREPFRLNDGRLLFRPGGHGALIYNLNAIKGDIVSIKNIDNIVPERLQDETSYWKKLLIGVLAEAQRSVHEVLQSLEASPNAAAVAGGVALIRERLGYKDWMPPAGVAPERALIDRLNRPLRVCGVVKNAGEPGGGPFWVRENDGARSKQIIERAQVGCDPQQESVFNASTHFNPVDIVAGLRDFRGEPFDLMRYTDPQAVFIAKKSHEGRGLQALELPGLWNGAMAGWITLFVEMPESVFNPVKTYEDWLRPGHFAK